MPAHSAGGASEIRPALPADAERICAIYNHYVAETIVTFEERPVAADEMRVRIAAVTGALPWLVLEREGGVAGYACAVPWKTRTGYRFTVESSIYLAPTSLGCGYGSALYGALLEALSSLNVHCVIGGAALPNPASAALHEKLGFEQVAHFRHAGWKFERWIDVAYWQRRLALSAPLPGSASAGTPAPDRHARLPAADAGADGPAAGASDPSTNYEPRLGADA